MVAGTEQEQRDRETMEQVLDSLLLASGTISPAQLALLNAEEARNKASGKKKWQVGRETILKFMPDGKLAKAFSGTEEGGSDVGDLVEALKAMPAAELLRLAHDMDITIGMIQRLAEFAVTCALRKADEEAGAQ